MQLNDSILRPYEEWKAGGRRLMSVRATIKDETHLPMHHKDGHQT